MKRLALLVSLCSSSLAWAGGFEFPDNNAEVLGRGATFTAKADDASAVEYNIAGLARQRGTSSLVSLNTVFHTYEFQRAGTYPDDPATVPYGGQPFPKVSNTGAPFPAPFLSIATDFNKLDRWTFSFAVFGPSAYGQRQYQNPANGLPGPARYDLTAENLLLVFPTLAAAYRVTKWLDIGVALHLVVGQLHFETTALVDLGKNVCATGETASCDSYTKLDLTGVSATAALGLMFHPLEALSIGVNLRGKVHLVANGTATAFPPSNPTSAQLPVDTQAASLTNDLPWVLRVGIRYAFLKDGFEQGDVEVDGTYEAWHDAQGQGIQVTIPFLSIFQNINPVTLHNYQDTGSVRVGGSYNAKLPTGVLSFRLGFYYDSAATQPKDTRLDFDTMDKFAPTVGLGYKVRGIAINLGYAYVWSPDRDVTNGDIQVLNAANNALPVRSASSEPTPVINNGHYHAETHVLGVSLNVNWDEALKHSRTIVYR
jgi:long-subunit fatty acid transport protein